MNVALERSGRIETLQKVTAYQNPGLIHRFKEKLGLNEAEALLLFDDMKKFLFLCSLDREISQSPPPQIDAAWHEFLMFTQDYDTFCNEQFGYFIHHVPRGINDPPTNGARTRKTVQLALSTFGSTLSANWNLPGSTDALAEDPCDSCGCNAAL